MPDGPVIAFSAAILESDDLLILALLDDFTRDGGAFDERRAVSEMVPIAVKKNIGEYPFFTHFSIEEIDINDVAFCHPMLSTAGFDDCESHGLGKSRAQSHGWALLTSGMSFTRPLNQERDLPLRGTGFIVSQ